MFCSYCGAKLMDGARFCSNCGKPVAVQQAQPAQAQPVQAQAYSAPAQPVVQQVQQTVQSWQQPVQAYQQASQIPANVVPKKIAGKRTINTNRAFTIDELRQFLGSRWNPMEYNYFVTDPSLKSYTDLYIVLPGTPRNMIIVYPNKPGLLNKSDSVSVSYIKSSAARWEMMMRAIPTQNAFFGAAKIAGNMSEKAEREGPTDEVVQRYADYIYYLLGQAGYLA